MTPRRQAYQGRQAAILAALVVICAGVYARTWRPSSLVPRGSLVLLRETQSPAIEIAEPETVDRTAQQQRAELLAWGRDPFLAGQGQATGEVALSGILWDAAHPLAIMNGAPVSVGDTVDGFQVLDIAPDRVTLSDGTTTYDVRLAP